MPISRITTSAAALLLALCTAGTRAQAPAPQNLVSITLEQAIQRAQASEPGYANARAASGIAGLDKSIAVSTLLPNVSYFNQMLYTQPNGLYTPALQGAPAQPGLRFIANNAVHEYISQGVVNETVGLTQFADVQRADAAAAVAKAQLEIARRGLVSTVTSLYFSAMSAQQKVAYAEEAHTEAADFVKLTTEREQGREAAHADVVKAELQEQQRARELADTKLAADKARLDLGVLLFPDPRTPYTLATNVNPAPLASRADMDAAAAKNNPDLKSAFAMVSQSNAEVKAARGAYLPDLGLNYTYGIDAAQFALTGPDHEHNLGYSASATLNIPVWDWLATEHRVKQSQIRRDAVKVALTATQRQLIAQLDEAYAEAATARDQLASLDLSVQTAAESQRLTKLRYTAGEATVLEVVDAQTAYLAAENAREDGRVRYEAALAGLQMLTGTM